VVSSRSKPFSATGFKAGWPRGRVRKGQVIVFSLAFFLPPSLCARHAAAILDGRHLSLGVMHFSHDHLTDVKSVTVTMYTMRPGRPVFEI
jgi:hypothetical protein